jgi:hypothetical protein
MKLTTRSVCFNVQSALWNSFNFCRDDNKNGETLLQHEQSVVCEELNIRP